LVSTASCATAIDVVRPGTLIDHRRRPAEGGTMQADTAQRTLVVTGVSSGIGHAIAVAAVKAGWHVFGSVRREQDGIELASQLGRCFTPLTFDVRDQLAIEKSVERVAQVLGTRMLAGLVNNAGVGLAGPLLHQPLDEFETVMDTNLLGTLRVTRAFAPLLGTDPEMRGAKGRIVNMSSIAGKVAQPFAGAYVASKHALEGLSDVLRRELALYDIQVIVVAPATVDTPIWRAPEAAIGHYGDTGYGGAFDNGVRAIVSTARNHGLTADKVAGVVMRALTARHPRVRYAPAQHVLLEQVLPRLAPKRLTDFAVRHALGLVGRR
jgi:NAD(P)-dependent dehydrogenase (short-subunit alcohol dehydrogenase family)